MNTSGITSGYVNFNKLLIQWGYIQRDLQTGTVTLLQSYATNSYTALINAWDSTYSACGTRNYTSTSFDYVMEGSHPMIWLAVGLSN